MLSCQLISFFVCQLTNIIVTYFGCLLNCAHFLRLFNRTLHPRATRNVKELIAGVFIAIRRRGDDADHLDERMFGGDNNVPMVFSSRRLAIMGRGRWGPNAEGEEDEEVAGE